MIEKVVADENEDYFSRTQFIISLFSPMSFDKRYAFLLPPHLSETRYFLCFSNLQPDTSPHPFGLCLFSSSKGKQKKLKLSTF